MKARWVVGLMLQSVLLLSCASYGREINAEAIRQNLKIGESTKGDVLTVAGEPLSKDFDTSGDEVWHYLHITKNVTPLGVISNQVGIGTEWKSNKTVVDVFFKADRVSDVRIETGSSTKMNLGL